MEREDYVAALRGAAAKLAEAAVDLTRPVPGCPEWTVADLLRHVGGVHRFWQQMASGAITDPKEYDEPEYPADADLVAWFSHGAAGVAEVLGGLDPAAPTWTWSSQHTAGFIQRRMAQETAVHAWDAASAAGRDRPIERELAVDGIDEFLEFFLPPPAPPEGFGKDIHLHTTDGPGEWLISPDDDGWAITREHAKGAVAVRATASDLLLLLWRRKGPGAGQVFGDEELLAGFLASAKSG